MLRRPDRRPPRWLWPAAGLLSALAFSFRAIFLGKVVAGRDVLRLFIPSSSYLLECLKAHVLPLWLPYVRLGQPFAASLQSQAFYPPQLFAVLLVGPVWTPTVLHLFNVVIAAVGSYLALRAISVGRRASVCGAAVFALSPMFAQMSYVPNLAGAAAWSGFVLLGAIRLRSAPGFRAAAMLAVPIALSLLCGAPEITLCQMLLAGLVLLAWPRSTVQGERRRAAPESNPRSPPNALIANEPPLPPGNQVDSDPSTPPRRGYAQGERRVASGIGFASLAIAWGFGLAALSLVPAAEFARHSTRTFTRGHLTWSIPFGQLVSAFLPLADQPRSGYWGPDQFLLITLFIGSTTLFLALLGVRDRRARPFWLCFAVLALLSLGENFAPSRFLLTHPPLGLFRYPAKYFVLAAFCASVLAALGLERLGALARRIRPSPRRALIAVGAVIVAFVVLLPLVQRPSFRTGLQVGLTWAAACLAILAATLFGLPARRRGVWVSRIALGLIAAEFVLALWKFPPAGWVEARTLTTPSPLAKKLPRPLDGRLSVVLPMDWDINAPAAQALSYIETGRAGLVPMQAVVEHLAEVEGYGPPEPERLEDVINSATRPVYDFFGVRYFVREAEPPFPDARPLGKTAVSALFQVATPYPRAFVVYRAVRASDAEAKAALYDPKEPLRATAYLATGEPLDASTACAPTPAREVERFGQATIDFTACAEGYLVVSDAYYPGWEARLDGQPVPIERADLVARAVRVPKGHHALEMRYRPKSFRFGLGLTLLSLLGLAVVLGRRR